MPQRSLRLSLSPWPFLGKWVQYKMFSDSYIFQCLSCLPKISELKVNKGIKANLKRHFNRIHPDKTKQVNEACMANVGATNGRSRNWSGQSAYSRSTSKKQQQMSIAKTFGIMAQGSAILESTIDNAIVRSVVDNILPLQTVDSQSFRNMVHTLNSSKDMTIVMSVVDNILLLQILYSQSFRDMVHTLNPSKEVPSRGMLGRKILKTY